MSKIWLAGNKLSINVAKTNSLVIGSRKKLKDIQCPLIIKPSFAISGEEISIIEHTKYLVVQVDQYMNWEKSYKSCDKKDFKGHKYDLTRKKLFPFNHLTDLVQKYS